VYPGGKFDIAQTRVLLQFIKNSQIDGVKLNCRHIVQPAHYSAYRNTIPLEHQAARNLHPGDVSALEERLTAIIRWNALAMVVRANQAYGELGGHIASYASAAEIFEVGFNHFFRRGRRGRRPGVLPAAFGARRLCARLSRGAAERGAAGATIARKSAARACAPIRTPG
jgi:hypothetical protein